MQNTKENITLSRLEANITSSIVLKERLLTDESIMNTFQAVLENCITAIRAGNKIFFCGNGGSSADAQHLAAELSGRYYYDRPPLFAEALNVNMAYITAVGNDYGYDMIFARAIQAKGRSGDILFALSTSGNSSNILKAVESAQKTGIITIGLTGISGGLLHETCDYSIRIPSSDTPRIQECHMLIGHTLCELIEETIFPKQ